MSNILEQASLVLVPSGYKESKIYSQIPIDGDGDLDFTRASNATRVNSAGLIEIPRTNLVTYSEEFDNAEWSNNTSTITANTTTAPNGTATADKLVVNSGASNVSSYVKQNYTKAASPLTLTSSFYAKAGEFNRVRLNIRDNASGSNNATVTVSLVDGSIVSAAANGTFSAASATVSAQANGWYRIALTFTTGSETVIWGSTVFALDSTATTGDGTSGLFIWGAQLEVGDIATEYIPTTSTAVSVGMTANVPRLDYSQGSCPSLLLEPQRTNLILQSEAFNNAAYTAVDTTITANAEISPDGTENAETMTISDFTSRVSQNVVLGPGTYTVSVYVKIISQTTAGTMRFVGVVDGSNTNVNFTPTTEWQRVTGIYTAAVGITNLAIRGNSGQFVGTVAIWGFQAEAGSYPTSYIPTLGTSVTRVADSASKTGISSLIGQTEGVLFLDFIAETPSEVRRVSLSNDDIDNRILIAHQPSGKIQFFGNESGSTQVVFETTQVYTKGDRVKVALAYKQNDFAGYINGVQMFTDNSANVGTSLFNFSFSDSNLSLNKFIGSVNQALLFKTRLSNTELAQITSL